MRGFRSQKMEQIIKRIGVDFSWKLPKGLAKISEEIIGKIEDSVISAKVKVIFVTSPVKVYDNQPTHPPGSHTPTTSNKH